MKELDWTMYDLLKVNNTLQSVPEDGKDHYIGNCWCEPESWIEDNSALVIHRAVN